jgi:hypothetical protein
MVALWSLVGLLVLASASWWVASREMGDAAYYLKRQAIWLVASWGLLWLAIRLNLRRWLRLAAPALLITGLMVAATLVAGSTVNGSSKFASQRGATRRCWRPCPNADQPIGANSILRRKGPVSRVAGVLELEK